MKEFKVEAMYKVSDKVLIEREEDNISLYYISSNKSILINEATYQFIYVFFIPRTLKTAIKELSNKFMINEEECKDILDNLIENNIIIKYKPKVKTDNYMVGGIFGTSIIPLNEVLSSELIKVVFLGFPYDLSVTYKSGCKFAPNALRKASTSIFNYKLENNVPTGMWSDVENRNILEGIFMADCGDVNSLIYHRNGKEFDFVRNIIAKLSKQNKFPVILGGDHSISLANILGILDSYDEVGIIHFDAHNDYGEDLVDDWKEKCHHGNFMNWIASNDKVKIIAQIGIRQLRDKRLENDKFKIWPGRKILADLNNLENTLSKDIPYYITFDVDCLDPSIMNSTGTVLPGGFLYNEVIEVLQKVCNTFNIIGLDICEFIPKDESDAIMISDIILRIIDYVTRRARK